MKESFAQFYVELNDGRWRYKGGVDQHGRIADNGIYFGQNPYMPYFNLAYDGGKGDGQNDGEIVHMKLTDNDFERFPDLESFGYQREDDCLHFRYSADGAVAEVR